MRRLLSILFILTIGAAVTATLLVPDHVVTRPLQLLIIVLIIIILLDRIFGHCNGYNHPCHHHG